MVDVRSDNVGLPDGHVRMVYRWADGVGWSDGHFGELTALQPRPTLNDTLNKN